MQVFHWLVADRVEYLETTPAGSRLQHIRIVAFMIVLLVRCSALSHLSPRSLAQMPCDAYTQLWLHCHV